MSVDAEDRITQSVAIADSKTRPWPQVFEALKDRILGMPETAVGESPTSRPTGFPQLHCDQVVTRFGQSPSGLGTSSRYGCLSIATKTS